MFLSVKNKIVENEIAILLMEEFTIEKKEGKPVHYHVKCDGCKKFPIIGKRYKLYH